VLSVVWLQTGLLTPGGSAVGILAGSDGNKNRLQQQVMALPLLPPPLLLLQVMVFEGTCYITPLLGAYLADSHWGRYKTILVFSTIYLLGMICLTTTSWLPGLTPGPTEDASGLQCAVLMGALAVIALGTGGIKPNVSAFGADQFDENDPQDKREKESFFNWFYLAINVGSLIACTVVVYVQDQISWTVGFALPAAAMAMAVLLFLAGSRHYRHVAPTESPMARVVKVVAAALTNR
jgi:dipeptide/tripeptide permease